MTGSSGAGKHVARESGMVNPPMELGGNAPAIVFDDADLDHVTGNCIKGSLKYAGQRCSAVSRVLAHESVHDELVDRIDEAMDTWEAGNLFDEGSAFGPLISEDLAEWVQELVDDAAGVRINGAPSHGLGDIPSPATRTRESAARGATPRSRN